MGSGLWVILDWVTLHSNVFWFSENRNNRTMDTWNLQNHCVWFGTWVLGAGSCGNTRGGGLKASDWSMYNDSVKGAGLSRTS